MSNETPGDIFLNAFNAFYQNLTGSTDEQIQEMKKLRLTCGKLDEIDKALKAFLRANELSNKDTRKLVDEIIKLQKAQTKMSGVSGSLSDKHIIATINRSMMSPNSEFDKSSSSELMKQMLAADTETNRTLRNLEKLAQDTVKQLNALGSKVANMSKKQEDEKKNGPLAKFFSLFKKDKKKAPGKGILGGIKDFFTGKGFWGKMVGAIVDGIFASRMLQNTLADVLKLGWLLLASWFDKHFGPKVSGIVAALTSGFAAVVTAVLSLKGLRNLIKGAKNLANLFKKGKGAKNAFKLTADSSKILKSFKAAKGLKEAKGAITTTKAVGTALMVLPQTGTALVPYAKTGTSLVTTGSKAAKTGTSLMVLPKTGTSLVTTGTKAGTKVAAKEGGKVLAKGVGKAAGKKVPGLGLLMGAGFTAGRLAEGDWLGAGAEALSTALPYLGGLAGGAVGALGAGVGAVPGAAAGTAVGTAGSLAIDAWLMSRDMKKANQEVSTGSATGGAASVAEEGGKKKGFWATIGGAIGRAFKASLKVLTKLVKKLVKPVLLIGAVLAGVKGIKTLLDTYLPAIAEGGGVGGEGGGGQRRGLWSRITGGLSRIFGGGTGSVSTQDHPPVDPSSFTSTPTSNLGQKGSKLDGRTITSAMGWRKHPVFGTWKYHTGIDIDYKNDEPVEAKLGGKVVAISANKPPYQGFGNTVVVDDGKNLNQYSHLHRFAKGLKVGDYVKPGDILGEAGSSGYSTGPHLHYQINAKNGGKTGIAEPASYTVQRRQEIEKGEGPAVPTDPNAGKTPTPSAGTESPKVSYDPSTDGGNNLAHSKIFEMKTQTNMRNYESLNC